MTRLVLFILLLLPLLLSCNKDDSILYKTSDFQINIAGQNTITYYNPECEFDKFGSHQVQYNGGADMLGYKLFSTYWNSNIDDSTRNQIWINLLLIFPPDSLKFTVNKLRNILVSENNSSNNDHLKFQIQLEIDGKRYYNHLFDNDPNTPSWESDDALYFEIEDYILDYTSDCVNRELLYMRAQIEGKLYEYDFFTKIDSIQINKSEMKLLFALD